jgi:hypothetical protein
MHLFSPRRATFGRKSPIVGSARGYVPLNLRLSPRSLTRRPGVTALLDRLFLCSA